MRSVLYVKIWHVPAEDAGKYAAVIDGVEYTGGIELKGNEMSSGEMFKALVENLYKAVHEYKSK